jgi:hypothetical protein
MRILLPILLLLLPGLANAELVLSEIMANEPGDTVALEWIEAYNNGDIPIMLDAYQLNAGGSWIDMPSIAVTQQSYVVFARQLVADSGRPSFESRWGDGSGYWGDNAAEAYVAIDLDIALPNGQGSVAIMNTDNLFYDYYDWTEALPDGISIERTDVGPPGYYWHSCTDSAGATPGRVNSPSRPTNDMNVGFEIAPRIIEMSRPTQFIVTISAPEGCQGIIEVFDDTARRVVGLLDAPVRDRYSFFWNGRDRDGRRLAPGIYLVRAEITGSVNVTKAIPVVIAP